MGSNPICSAILPLPDMYVKISVLYFFLFYLFTFIVFSILIYFFGKYYYFWILFFAGHYIVTLTMVTYLQVNQSWFSEYKLFWCWIFTIFPYFSFFAFLIYGRGFKLKRPLQFWLKKEKKLHFENADKYNQKFLKQYQFSSLVTKTFHFLKNNSWHPIYHNVNYKLIYSTYQKLKFLKKSISSAQKYILINYYLFREGESLEIFINLLLKKLKEGVKVYLIFDFFGDYFCNQNLKKLLKAGAKIANKGKKIQPSNEIFYNNHRKIIVIDGTKAYIGSFNFNDQNANLSSFGYWIDLHLEITGLAVKSIENIFLKDWLFWTDEILMLSPRINLNLPSTTTNLKNICQFIDESPRVKTALTKDTFFHLFNQAKKSIYLTTPFFFPDEQIKKALLNASLSGLDVRIFLPGVSLPIFSLDFNRLYYDELIKAGVKIYELKTAYIHSKLIVADDEIVALGSANIDFRSFYFASETTLIAYDPQLSHQLKTDFFLKNLSLFKLIKTNPLRKKMRFYIWFLRFCQIAKIFF